MKFSASKTAAQTIAARIHIPACPTMAVPARRVKRVSDIDEICICTSY
jgi:hypothetical protein